MQLFKALWLCWQLFAEIILGDSCCQKSIDCGYLLWVEVKIAQLAIQVSIEEGYSSFLVEGDAPNVLNPLTLSLFLFQWTISSIVANMLLDLHSFPFRVRLMFRFANSLAHNIACWVFCVTKWEISPSPPSCLLFCTFLKEKVEVVLPLIFCMNKFSHYQVIKIRRKKF